MIKKSKSFDHYGSIKLATVVNVPIIILEKTPLKYHAQLDPEVENTKADVVFVYDSEELEWNYVGNFKPGEYPNKEDDICKAVLGMTDGEPSVRH